MKQICHSKLDELSPCSVHFQLLHIKGKVIDIFMSERFDIVDVQDGYYRKNITWQEVIQWLKNRRVAIYV